MNYHCHYQKTCGVFKGSNFHSYTATLASNASLCVLTSSSKPSQGSEMDTRLLLLDYNPLSRLFHYHNLEKSSHSCVHPIISCFTLVFSKSYIYISMCWKWTCSEKQLKCSWNTVFSSKCVQWERRYKVQPAASKRKLQTGEDEGLQVMAATARQKVERRGSRAGQTPFSEQLRLSLLSNITFFQKQKRSHNFHVYNFDRRLLLLHKMKRRTKSHFITV